VKEGTSVRRGNHQKQEPAASASRKQTLETFRGYLQQDEGKIKKEKKLPWGRGNQEEKEKKNASRGNIRVPRTAKLLKAHNSKKKRTPNSR